MGICRPWMIAAAGVALAACAGGGGAELQQERAQQRIDADFGITGESFFDLFRRQVDPDRVLGVNRFLWAASLDTLAFLPLEGADPFTGVIVTDWCRVGADPTPYRVTVLITEPALDARSLRVAAFRQQGGRAVPVAADDNRRIENAILTRARQIRIAEAGR
ncbi:hypothetical protein BH23PSE1_BH23PSE1_17080 [soil metagenome]